MSTSNNEEKKICPLLKCECTDKCAFKNISIPSSSTTPPQCDGCLIKEYLYTHTFGTYQR